MQSPVKLTNKVGAGAGDMMVKQGCLGQSLPGVLIRCQGGEKQGVVLPYDSDAVLQVEFWSAAGRVQQRFDSADFVEIRSASGFPAGALYNSAAQGTMTAGQPFC